eukprot:jgi/Botrbrau1/3877/Bobra.0183s0100.2
MDFVTCHESWSLACFTPTGVRRHPLTPQRNPGPQTPGPQGVLAQVASSQDPRTPGPRCFLPRTLGPQGPGASLPGP